MSYNTIKLSDARLFNYSRCIIIHHHTDYDVWLTLEHFDSTFVPKYVSDLSSLGAIAP